MRKFVIKCILIIVPIYLLVVSLNYFVDPANIYHVSVTDRIYDYLKEYPAVEVVGDFDEGALLEKRIMGLEKSPDTVVIGSSHVLYVAWKFDDFFNAGMSGEFLDDYYATVALLEEYDKVPNRVILAVDPYIFMDELTIRQESLYRYAQKEKALLSGEKEGFHLQDNAKYKKAKELFSFSYFQSSLHSLIYGVSSSYTNPTYDTGIGEYTKLLQNGVRVPASSAFNEVGKIRGDAEWYVGNGTIYTMSDYRSLSEKKISEFERLIDHLLENGVDVEIYLPSWYHIYYDEFESNILFSGVILSEEYVRDMAKVRGLSVHGSYSPYVTGLSEDSFIDSMHIAPEQAWENYCFILSE